MGTNSKNNLLPLIVGNWKMNADRQQAQALITAINTALSEHSLNAKSDVVICPTFVHLSLCESVTSSSNIIALGAQNVCAQEQNQGAYTGEISADMLKDAGCQYVIIGHSERRTYYAEDNESVLLKAKNALAAGLTPIICVGETLEQKEANQTQQVISEQLDAFITSAALEKIVVAYEPIWAIGTGLTASPEQAQAVHQMIRDKLNAVQDQNLSRTRILYGGSVKPNNAGELLSQTDIDGVLVGGASLKSEDFVGIITASSNG